MSAGNTTIAETGGLTDFRKEVSQPITKEGLDALHDLMGDAEVVTEVLEDLLRCGVLLLPTLIRADQDGDVARVSQIAHSLKGASQTVGAWAMGDAAQRVEEAARIGDLETLRARLPRLQREWERLSAFLETLLDGGATPVALSLAA